MRRHIGAVGATLTATGLILAGPALIGRAATAQTTQANAALRYLYAQVGNDGSIASAFGPGATEDVVIGVADNGYDPATLKSASTGTSTYQYLAAQAASITTAGGAAKYVLAWVAAGKPAAIDGATVLAKLNAPAPGGYLRPNGAFRSATDSANVYTQSLAVLADLSAGLTPTTAETGWLVCAQRADGGYGSAITDSAASPPASGCGDTHGSDSNATAIALQALGLAGVTTERSAATSFLHSVQDADGGFPFSAGDGSDPDSDGTVIQALVAIGEDPTATAWTVGGKNALTNLEAFADTQSGGYTFPGNATPDAFTTSTIPAALALKPYGAGTTFVAGSSPPPAPVVTASPTPTGSVKAVTVPATGSVDAFSVGSGPALLLVALGSVIVAIAALRRPPRSAP